MNRRLAIFDFCDTLTDFQTADRFVDFVLKGHRTPLVLLRDGLRAVFHRLRLLTGEKNKRAKLALLNGLPASLVQARARTYLDSVLLPRLRPEILEALFRHKRNGDYLVLASGGYDTYLNFFAERYGIDRVVCTEIRFSRGVCDGAINGADCMGAEKWRRIQSAIAPHSFDLVDAFAYSDSRSDMPMLAGVGHPVIVSRTPFVPWNPGNKFSVLVVK